ncbi:NADH dehydrogenase [ubiquinone] flavoprotein 3, mitochondrial isoform X2 [Mastomys coucha]|uniref:NADH dehydrogenase [ubiquinone] flavoprotein 3, mitochondrial isoform X2 n=1 Tax=Mastomys coucha TaxID=35658 RepID=UPI0012623C44|nr:NADH dehydrogenase [ubiquinone] flavoprotein 3, mitochondrial isoform X2 [Mastomys coucha]
MAVSLLLRGGRIRALKAALLEARVFRGEVASTVSLSTDSENSEKGERPYAPTVEEPELTDTTTYKNLQHHDYNTYTFLDLNLDLSKFRLPQPSSGRESPRH